MSKQAKKPLAIFLMGPTASGKTDLAMRLCDHLPVEIISVDSALIYKGMDIGTAKPSSEELAKYPHKLVDILDPLVSYSAADFRKDALLAMEEITSRGKIPLLVGGTMLYFKALLDGLSPLPSSQIEVRAEIDAEAKEHGWQYMHEKLQEIDPISAARIHPNDPQRLSRALEVYKISGKTLTELTQIKGKALEYETLQFAIAPKDRAVLHQRIELRFKNMQKHGFTQEVEKLYKRGDLNIDLPSIRCVGYRQMWEYLDNKIDLEEAEFRGICASRQLAKRQITWLRGWKTPIIWLDSLKEDDSFNKVVSEFSKMQ